MAACAWTSAAGRAARAASRFDGVAQVAEDALQRLGAPDGAVALRLGPRLGLHLLEAP